MRYCRWPASPFVGPTHHGSRALVTLCVWMCGGHASQLHRVATLLTKDEKLYEKSCMLCMVGTHLVLTLYPVDISKSAAIRMNGVEAKEP